MNSIEYLIIRKFNMKRNSLKAKACPPFFKYKVNPKLLIYIGLSTHIANGPSKCPFQDNSILVFRPEWLLI